MDQEMTDNTGIKHDEDKLRWDLLPPDAMREIVSVLTQGAKKYTDRNWEKGMKYGRLKAAHDRHINDWELGETFDPELRTHHLANAICCLLFLLTYELRQVGTDDLRKRHVSTLT